MFNVDLFIKEMIRKGDAGSITEALLELWPLCFDIVHSLTVINEPNVPVGVQVNEVKAIYIAQVPLSRTREILLDIEDPAWRNAASALPRAYIWRGENNLVQLHPPPDAVYVLWGLVQITPSTHSPKWFNLVAALRAVELLAVGDQVVGRVGMVKLMQTWREAFLGSFK